MRQSRNISITGPGMVVNHEANFIKSVLEKAGYTVVVDNPYAKGDGFIDDPERNKNVVIYLSVNHMPWGG